MENSVNVKIDNDTLENEVEIVMADAIPRAETSMYARLVTRETRWMNLTGDERLWWLKTQQLYANDLLKTKGRLYLNKVYEMLDLPKTAAGEYVGWRYDPDDPTVDNYVDFDIYNINQRCNIDFVNGYGDIVMLDFNVDGII